MTRRLAGHALGLVLACLFATGLAVFASSQGVVQDVGERIEAGREPRRDRAAQPPRSARPRSVPNPGPAERNRERPGDGGPFAAVARTGEEVTETVWAAIRLPLLALLMIGAAICASRTAHRRRRLAGVRRFELRLGREDEASPFKREKLFDAWHGQLSPRWWRRLIARTPSLALELHHGLDGTQRLVLATDPGNERMLAGRLSETYPDVRLIPLEGVPSWTGGIVRMKKRGMFIDRLQTLKDDEQTLYESLVSTLARLGSPATVQIVLTPAPQVAHRFARSLLKRRERELTRREGDVRHDIGVDSVVEDKELKGALETQHRSLYFTEIRIAADSKETVRALAGVLSETRAENALVQREMRLRHRLYADRLALAASNPVPSWWRGVLSSSELGALWALPRQRAKGARLVRSPVRRVAAPPEVCREAGLALMRDEYGLVGLHPEDRKYGLALIGGQGTGKTSAMARTIAIDAQDRGAAMIVLDPKHDLAQHALSLVPEDRTCWYMDLAHPEVGIDPLGVDAQPGVVADMLVAALREANADGAIMAASDRFLRHAAMAVCAIEERPTLWHMLELLSPRRDEYRERVTERLATQPEHAALLRYWGTSFPELWSDATRGQLGMALDAPRNKLERLITTVEVDKALRHPFALDLRRVIRDRQVLIVNGSLGEVGQDNAVTVMQLLIQLLHQALKQQQLLPADQRPRACLKVDEAHLVLTPSFAELLALHRAAGLEVVAAWQYNAQLQDPVIRSGLRSLLRSVSMFAMGEVRDARDQAEIAMEVYTDSIKTEREDLERLRVSPDDVVRLPVHTAVNSWVGRGARRSAFVAETFPIEDDNGERREAHLTRQRGTGAGWPAQLGPPTEVAPLMEEGPGPADQPPEDPQASSQGGAPSATPPGEQPDLRLPHPVETEPDRREIAAEDPPEAGHPPGPPSYLAVHREDVTGISWDRHAPDPDLARALTPASRDLELLAALWEHRLLLTSQIASEWWPDNSPTAAQRRLAKLARAGWVRRFRPTVVQGNHEWIYQLAQDGFALAKTHHGPDGPYLPSRAQFVDRSPTDHRVIAHDLQVNGWVLAYRRLARDLIAGWRGPDRSTVEVPSRTGARRGRPEPIGPADVKVEGYVQIRGLRRKEFARVSPDATLELALASGRRFDVLIELDRTRRPRKNDSKLLRYDALLTAWWRAVPRYRELGEPPAVVFISQDEEDLNALMRLADTEVTGCLANPGDPPIRWRYPGRERMLFVCERDVHDGSAAAHMLPTAPASGDRRGELRTRSVQLPKGRS